MKHTFGPWEVKPTEEGVPYLRVRGTRLGEKYKIANVPLESDFYKKEAEANAQLIAAAPELLEACEILHDASQDVFNLLAGSRPLITVPQALDAIVEAMSKARAAINKARGEK